MSKLIFKLKGNEEKWPARIENYLGAELAAEAKTEIDATASEYLASIQLLNYKKNQTLEDKIKADKDIISAFIIDNKEIKQRLV
jgi:hypothetical protein